MPAIMMASTTAGGTAATTGPIDTCKTPAAPSPVPTPYPNMAQVSQARQTTTKVKIGKKPVVTISSKISRSSGDEAGTLKGMISQTNMGPVSFKKASEKVKAQGKKVVYASCMTGHNGNNANAPAGAQMAPSQTKVRIAP